MDVSRIDLLLKYTVAAAGQEDAGKRELGPIHLTKYVYLADLAFAESHGGRTFTRARWRFHHFGPWSSEVYERIAPAVAEIGAVERHIHSKFSDDGVRWSVDDGRLFEELGEQLPIEVSRAIRRVVQQFGQDTVSLLHFVYTTAPMLRAAPGELLEFEPADNNPPTPTPTSSPDADELLEFPPADSREPVTHARSAVGRASVSAAKLVPDEPQSAVADAAHSPVTSLSSTRLLIRPIEQASETGRTGSKAEKRHRSQKIKALRDAIQARLKKTGGEPRAKPMPQPRYDDVYAEGVKWLDKQAGETMEPTKGEMIFSNDVWKSRGRGDPNLS
jgi:hypothetical protein